MRTFVIIAMFLAGCAPSIPLESRVSAWMGHPKQSLVAAWGQPYAVTRNADGSEVVEYMHGKTTHEPGFSMPLGTVSGVGPVMFEAPGEIETKTCHFVFAVSPAGAINSYRYAGDYCRRM